jgi:adenylate kinase family enzyme
LARTHGLKDIELDALHWEAGWQGADPEVFRQRLIRALSGDGGFVVHGNYGKVRDLTWGSCDVVVWLDYPRWIVMARVFRRTVLRLVRREVLWRGNRETFRKSFLSRDSILVWAWTTFRRRSREYRALVRACPYPVRVILRVRHPRDARILVVPGPRG